MTESLHKIIKNHPLPHDEVDDILQEFSGWLLRNYQHDWKFRETIDKICDDIWESCKEADKEQ
jgi:hypothetical protein